MSCIGIDLGTTISLVAALRNVQVIVFENGQGQRILYLCVEVTESQRPILEPTKHQTTLNSQNTIFGVKRLIGRWFNDAVIQQDCRKRPFCVFPDTDGRPKIKIGEGVHQKESPKREKISAMILEEIAEKCLDEKVCNAVITVPAYFSHKQRQATKNAAAITCGMLKHMESVRTVSVYDLGGGTFDATVLTMDGKDFDVKASTGDGERSDYEIRIPREFQHEPLQSCEDISEFLATYFKSVTNKKSVAREAVTGLEIERFVWPCLDSGHALTGGHEIWEEMRSRMKINYLGGSNVETYEYVANAENVATVQQKYGVLEENARYKMLLASGRKAKLRGRTDYGKQLKRSMQAFTGAKLRIGRATFKELCRVIASRIPENKWMRFVRLHLNLTEVEIQKFRRKYCTFNDEQQRQILQSRTQKDEEKEERN